EWDVGEDVGGYGDRVVVATDGDFLQTLGLPGEHGIRHALECLAEHDEAAGGGIACTQVQVAEPAAPAAAAPFSRQHDEVESVGPFDLEPTRTARAGLVRRVERLCHDALVAAGERLLDEGACRLRVGGDETRD